MLKPWLKKGKGKGKQGRSQGTDERPAASKYSHRLQQEAPWQRRQWVQVAPLQAQQGRRQATAAELATCAIRSSPSLKSPASASPTPRGGITPTTSPRAGRAKQSPPPKCATTPRPTCFVNEAATALCQPPDPRTQGERPALRSPRDLRDYLPPRQKLQGTPEFFDKTPRTTCTCTGFSAPGARAPPGPKADEASCERDFSLSGRVFGPLRERLATGVGEQQLVSIPLAAKSTGLQLLPTKSRASTH
jgi:hypothetical protein